MVDPDAKRDTRSRAVRKRLANDMGGSSDLAEPKSSEVLAANLRRRILTGELAEGEALPVERTLAAETGMSRTAVREALRMLEAQGLTYTKAGRGGGSFIRRPSADTMEQYLGVFIAGRQVDFQSLVEIREALEPMGAELAAVRRTEEEVHEMDRILDDYEAAFDDIPRFLTLNTDWHVAVVRASHNELLHAVMLSLSNAILQGTGTEDFASERVRLSAIKAHRSVVDAIRKQDAGLARRAMTRHLTAYRDEVELYTAPPSLVAASRRSGARRKTSKTRSMGA